jgi:hypothetical protein
MLTQSYLPGASQKGKKMLKKYSSSLFLVMFLLTPATRLAMAAPQGLSADQAKVQVAKLGLGEKARATITLKNGTKVKGYVARADENDFVIRDRKTDTPTTISYSDVAKVEKNKGHSTARNLGLGIGIGVGAFLAVIAITFAHLND